MTPKRILVIAALALSVSGAATLAVAFIWPTAISHVLPKLQFEQQPAHERPFGSLASLGKESPATMPQVPETGANKEFVLAAAADYAPPSTRRSVVAQAVRDVFLAQAGMARGDKEAPHQLKAAMRILPPLLRRPDPEELTSTEVQSAALYVLSGGEPASLDALSISPRVAEAQRKLLQGVKDYASADLEKARKELDWQHSEQFNSVLAAQLSIARAQLLPVDDFEQSVRYLAFAADSVPGSLIEEAAMRRIVDRSANAKSSAVLFYWSQRYLRRFPNSLYYQDFQTSLVSAISSLMAKHVKLEPDALKELFRVAGESRAAALSHLVLLQALHSGNTDFCRELDRTLAQSYVMDSTIFRNVSALVKICNAAEGGPQNLAALRALRHVDLDTGVTRLLEQAISISETIEDDTSLVDDGRFGPGLPLASEPDYADLVASVTQQLGGSIKTSNRIGTNESDLTR